MADNKRMVTMTSTVTAGDVTPRAHHHDHLDWR